LNNDICVNGFKYQADSWIAVRVFQKGTIPP
jgi:hypothetical protein